MRLPVPTADNQVRCPSTHGRWPFVAAALVVPTWGAALARRGALRRDAWVAMLGLPILVAHQTEERVRPGGFLPFCNERLLGGRAADLAADRA